MDLTGVRIAATRRFGRNTTAIYNIVMNTAVKNVSRVQKNHLVLYFFFAVNACNFFCGKLCELLKKIDFFCGKGV